jgi:hypothetical protein
MKKLVLMVPLFMMFVGCSKLSKLQDAGLEPEPIVLKAPAGKQIKEMDPKIVGRIKNLCTRVEKKNTSKVDIEKLEETLRKIDEGVSNIVKK